MANTYTLINSGTMASAAQTFSFNSIPATYTDLKLVMSIRNTLNGVYWFGGIKFNSSSANFIIKTVEGDGTNALSQSLTQGGGLGNGPTSTSNTYSNVELYISNYASTLYKSYILDTAIENNGTGGLVGCAAGLWSDTQPINAIEIYPAYYGSSDLVAGSSFYLYGISNT